MAFRSPLAPAVSAYAFPDALLSTLLAVSLSAVNLLRPVYGPDGPDGPDGPEIVDFALDYLNPAAQRMTGLPEQPGTTALARFPEMASTGVFDFYRRTYASDAPGAFELYYQADGIDNYFRLAAQRHQDLLVVSFTDTGDQPRTPVENALRDAQAAERAARADAEEQRAALGRAFEQAPVSIAILRGAEFVVELANPSLGALWGRPVGPALGRPLFEALPDLAGQGLEELLDQALRTGEPLVFRERPTRLARDPAEPPALGYYNFTYQPLHDAQGRTTGLITVGLDVTEQVVARQQLHQLNQELEARVQERTQEALSLQADLLAAAQQQADQRALLYQVFEQTPALVALLRAPGHRFEYVNPAYQALFPGRQLVGRDAAEAAPEMAEQGFVALIEQVYRTGETYYGQEMPFTPRPAPGEASRARYFNFTYQAYREGGAVAGVSVFAYDVTEQVRARQQREAERQQLHHL
ncbi:PAS domain-containing protein, partial [Hymenobacter amundsenii]|uniref:PAS domain-containing protein n=1 Tax=Hymenobacter amundsenii TaxID=2006685 RepID=UPI000F8305C3